jgi:hypothetical protein
MVRKKCFLGFLKKNDSLDVAKNTLKSDFTMIVIN